MRIGGAWVGWGLGDCSAKDFTVRDAKAFMRRKFPSYAGNLADTNRFDQAMVDAVFEMQRRYNAAGKLHAPTGILDMDESAIALAKAYMKMPAVGPGSAGGKNLSSPTRLAQFPAAGVNVGDDSIERADQAGIARFVATFKSRYGCPSHRHNASTWGIV